MQTRLFSNTQRSDLNYQGYAEPIYTFLNRSGLPIAVKIRSLLEHWFSDYPESEQPELMPRLQSDDDSQFNSAFFELYIYTLLKRLGHDVKVHPNIETTNGKKPDFLAKQSCGQDFIVEAVCATDTSEEAIATQNRINLIYDTIDKLQSPDYFLFIQLKGSSATQPQGRKLRNQLEKWLAQLDYDEVSLKSKSHESENLPHLDYTSDGWDITFSPIPKLEEYRGNTSIRPIGIRMGELRWVNPKKPIRQAVLNKGRQYGDINMPFVIAVNANFSHADDEDIIQSLIGTKTWLISPNSEPTMKIKWDGAWTTPSGPRYTRISAALVGTSIQPWNISKQNMRLYHNPWAKLAYTGTLCSLPQAVPSQGKFEPCPGLHPREIFKLSEEWPKEQGEI